MNNPLSALHNIIVLIYYQVKSQLLRMNMFGFKLNKYKDFSSTWSYGSR